MQVLIHNRVTKPLVHVRDDQFQCSLPAYKFDHLTQRNFQCRHKTFCMGSLRLKSRVNNN